MIEGEDLDETMTLVGFHLLGPRVNIFSLSKIRLFDGHLWTFTFAASILATLIEIHL